MGILPRYLLSIIFSSLLFTSLSGKNEGARMMVHLLDYIAVDYSMAVQNGEVISVAEYKEMQEFASTLRELGKNTSGSMQSDIILLSQLIEDKASQDKISSVASGLKQKIIERYKLEVAPKRWPSLQNGRKLFALQCESCHGINGKGDGSLAPGLEPAPTNFHSPDKANGLSPFQAYNTIRLGVENTGMRAFNELNDDEVWDLAFYVLSLPHQKNNIDKDKIANSFKGDIDLETLASSSNNELILRLNLDSNDVDIISSLRLYPKEIAEKSQGDYLDKAIRLTREAAEVYKAGDHDAARNLALTAYLEGVEPVEVQLRANDAAFVAKLEGQLAKMRSVIEADKDVQIIRNEAQASIALLEEAQSILAEQSFSGWMTFLLSSTIVLREGLEAFLVIITILSIIRTLNIPHAAAWVHSGWISAIGLGFLLWLAADNLFTFSGAQREVMEGVIALFAVGVLLYVGFWMHSKSEAGKWQKYIKDRIKNLARKENMLGLAFLSFMVVFREAFESVLFLSALNMEAGEDHKFEFISGILVAFVLIGIFSVLFLKYSKKIPITQLFKYSALIISGLAVILAGKGVNALQEAGVMNISVMPIDFRSQLFGFYPTWQTFFAQLFILLLVFFLWKLSHKKSNKISKAVKV